MDSKILFIQQAVSRKYLKQSFLADFFANHSFGGIPENIGEILIEENVLTQEQVDEIYRSVGEVLRTNLTASPPVKETLTLSLSGGEIINIDIPEPIVIDAEQDSSLVDSNNGMMATILDNPSSSKEKKAEKMLNYEIGQTILEDSSNNEIGQTLLEDSVEKFVPTAPLSQIGVTIADDSQEIAFADSQAAFADSQVPTNNLRTLTDPGSAQEDGFFVVPETGISPENVVNDTAIRESYQALQASSDEDSKIMKEVIAKKKMTIHMLEECLKEQKRLSLSGQKISLAHLLVDKNILSENEVQSILKEHKTLTDDTELRELGGQRILFDKYKVIKKLGAGGMGSVFKVEHMMLQHNKYFALKVMLPFIASNEMNYKRFVREVETAMSLTHKNLIPIREFGVLPNGSPYLTMDFSVGETLENILKDNWKRDRKRSFTIVLQILEGLQEAHRNNIIHRDLKPANILVEKDESGKDLVKIVDFGLAKLVEEAEESITQGTVGTPHYMSPQQASGEKVDKRADLYSVGIILYEMLLGRLPFNSNTLRGLLKAQMFDPPPPPHEVDPSIPVALEAILLKSLEKDVEARFQTAEEFIQAINDFIAGGAPVEIPKVKSKPTQHKQSQDAPPKSKAGILAAAVLLLAIAAGVAYKWEALTKTTGSNSNGTTANNFDEVYKQIIVYRDNKLWREANWEIREAEKQNYTEEQREKLKEMKMYLATRLKEEGKYRDLMQQVDSCEKREDYDRAIGLLQSHMKMFPDSSYKKLIDDRVITIRNLQNKDLLLARKDFQTSQEKLMAYKQSSDWAEALQEIAKIEKMNVLKEDEKQKIAKWKQEIEQQWQQQKDFEKTNISVDKRRSEEKYDEAIELWQAYLKQYPDTKNRLEIERQMDRLKFATKSQQQQEYRKSFEKAKELFDSKQWTKAVFALDNALKQQETPEVLSLLGQSYYHAKEYKKALEYLEKSQDLALDPVKMLFKMHLKSRQTSKAVGVLEKAAEKYRVEDNSEGLAFTFSTLGLLYEKDKRYNEAMEFYEKALPAVRKQKDNEELRNLSLRLGLLIYKHSNNKQDSLAHLKTYRDLGGNNSQADEILLSFTDFTPMAFGMKWKYRNRIMISGKYRERFVEYELAAIDQQDQYRVKVDGKLDETWYRKGEYVYREFRSGSSDKVLRYPVKQGTTWDATVNKSQVDYKIVAVDKIVVVPAGTFHNCVEVERTAFGQKESIFYAPDVGEVKRERSNFIGELIEYSK